MNQSDLHQKIGSIDSKVTDLHTAMFGNGKPGIKERVLTIESHINHCTRHKAETKLDWKFVVMAVIAVAAILKDIF
jgi:hypothetical protein